jgi:uncharacterized RmlC-like cupin family protein
MTSTNAHRTGDTTRPTPSAHLADYGSVLHVVGARIELLTPLAAADELPCLLRGTIPPGGMAALHSHPDPETFIGIDGQLEGLTRYAHGTAWVPLHAGDIFHVPGDVPHAFRNRTQLPATALIVTTTRLARFFCEVALPPTAAAETPPSEAIAAFLETSRRYGHWHGTPRENADIGLSVPPLPPN